jgi:biotin carboxyl carrier protein
VAEQTPQRRADGTWHLVRAGTAIVAHAVTDAEGAVWVHIAGEVVVLPLEVTAPRQATLTGHATLEAPMPAQVIAVLVEAGDRVDAGATLVLLEAMKMELPLKAPSAGSIEAVHCHAGQRVAPGTILVDLVPAGQAP